MIPSFPLFKKIDIDDREEVNKLTSKYPPYSDFTFTSLMCWDTKKKLELSKLHGNLVVKFQDYTSGDHFYSFIGHSNLERTIFKLIALNKAQNLKLIPEHSLSLDIDLISQKYDVIEDIDNHDHVLIVEKLVDMRGFGLFKKRNKLKRFRSSYEDINVTFKRLTDSYTHRDILQLLKVWELIKEDVFKVNSTEFKAIKNMFKIANLIDLHVMFVYVGSKLAGFSVFEMINKEYALLSFQKADYRYVGVYEFLAHSLASHLEEKGVKYINVEQDLGIKGLRIAKLAYKPIALKKFIIKSKSADQNNPHKD